MYGALGVVGCATYWAGTVTVCLQMLHVYCGERATDWRPIYCVSLLFSIFDMLLKGVAAGCSVEHLHTKSRKHLLGAAQS